MSVGMQVIADARAHGWRVEITRRSQFRFRKGSKRKGGAIVMGPEPGATPETWRKVAERLRAADRELGEVRARGGTP
jgi:hypothetical protein